MNDNSNLFQQLLKEFHSHQILDSVILIGSWALPIYKSYFSNAPEIPILRTTDVDFLIPNPPKISTQVNIPEILKKYDFDEQFSLVGNYTKFVHPDLEVEFLIPEFGRSKDNAIIINDFNITAQPLRYLQIIQDYILEVLYNDLLVRVPEPTVFTLLKYLLTIKRKNSIKINKDISTANELTDFLLEIPEQVNKFKKIFQDMPKPWRKKLINIIKQHRENLYDVLQ